MPPVTDDHRRAAFRAWHWLGWSYEQAMADPLRSRLVNLRARQICNAQARAPRFVFDAKRAAAGDRDD